MSSIVNATEVTLHSDPPVLSEWMLIKWRPVTFSDIAGSPRECLALSPF
jgi:hypothetical protein